MKRTVGYNIVFYIGIKYAFTPFNISNADFISIKIIKKYKINRRAYSYEVVS